MSGRRTKQAQALHAWMLAAETVLLRIAEHERPGPGREDHLTQVAAMQPLRHEWRWLAGVGENPRLDALRIELDALHLAAHEHNGGAGQGAYCLAIGLLEQRIREIEQEVP